jgi:CHAT domain-containing protein/Tfp pilus assembly protein PilF
MPGRAASVIAFAGLCLLCACGKAPETEPLDPDLERAITLYREEGAEKALPEFEQLAQEFKSRAQRRDEAAAIHYIGESHWRLGNFDDARSHLDRALAMERAAGYRMEEGKTLNSLGLLEWDLGNYEPAKEKFRSARVIGRGLGDRKLEGASLNNLSLVYDELGDYRTSLKQYHEVLAIYEDANFPRGLGDTLGNIGGVHLLLGHYREALDYYGRALEISQRLKSKPSMSQDHGNIALCHLGLGDVDAALNHFDQAIALAKQSGMQQDEAYWMRGKGNGLVQTGRYDQGLDLHRAALAIYESVEAQAELAEALHDMGQLYLLLGDPDSAERHFKRALDLAQTIGLSRGITQNLLALGDLQLRRERLADAAALYEKARLRAAESEQQQYVAQSLLRLALVHREQKHVDEASKEIGRALVIAREIGARPVESESLFAQAELDRRRRRLKEALAGFDSAEVTLGKSQDPDLLWQIQYGRALTYKALGIKAAAIDELIEAVKLIESVRNRLREKRFRAGYVQDKYEVYIELVRLQLDLGRTEDAFVTAERLRSRHFAEQLGERASAALSERDRREEFRLRERIRHLQRALLEEEEQDQPSSRQLAMASLSDELSLAEQDYQTFLDDRVGALPDEEMPDAIPDVAIVQGRLANDEALLEYVVGAESLFMFVVTPRGVNAISKPIRRSDLSSRISLLRDMTRRPGDNRWVKPAAGLSAILIEPLQDAGWLQGVRQLYVVPHGVLNYLPFALLPRAGTDDTELLMDQYTVAFLPTATALLRATHIPDGPRSLLAMAPGRSRLRHAPEEARSIDALFQPNSQLLLGDRATESRFKTLASGYRVLHLATHGFFNKLNPLMSGVELEADDANDGLLQVHEVLDLHLAADLVTLSACDTALSSGQLLEMPAGDELIGLTRAFLSAGSDSVLATLWEVDDQSSVRLMASFYAHMNGSTQPENMASALSRAQQELRSTKETTHPYFWAPFTLVGRVSQMVGPEEIKVGRATT